MLYSAKKSGHCNNGSEVFLRPMIPAAHVGGESGVSRGDIDPAGTGRSTSVKTHNKTRIGIGLCEFTFFTRIWLVANRVEIQLGIDLTLSGT